MSAISSDEPREQTDWHGTVDNNTSESNKHTYIYKRLKALEKLGETPPTFVYEKLITLLNNNIRIIKSD